ncbi:MAG: protein kinase [Myxococcota bacterium]
MTIALPRGAVLNERYVVQEELGRGTRGVVHAAKDLMAMRRVAIKILSNDAGPLGERLGAELTSEAHALKHARVPGVVRFLDEGRHDGMQYLVTELVDGIEFPGGVASAEKRAPGDAELKPLGRQLVGLASTLRRVHALGMVHGDIKPQNVLVRSSTAECVLLDFGFSRLVRLAAKEGVSSGRVVGTPLYMAPEMIGGY